jgi:hypothetical protein
LSLPRAGCGGGICGGLLDGVHVWNGEREK